MSAPIYLYTGPEFGRRNEAVDTVKKSLKKKFGEIDEYLFYLLETPLSEVLTILSGGTLFTDATCIVCKNAELLKKKEDISQLTQWLEMAEDSSVLILISDEVSVDSKLDKLVPDSNKKKFWEMFENEKLPWVKNYFRKNGFSITDDAAQQILDMVENNTEALKNECSRFFICFPENHEITADDVDSILIHNREESAFTLFNKISNYSQSPEKRLEAGLAILKKICLSKDNSSVKIIAGLASCFRKLILWHNLNSDYSCDEFTLKKNGFSSSLMQNQYRNAAKIWTVGQTTGILAILASTDMEIRSGGTVMEEILLQKMLYEIVIKKGASIQVPDYSEGF